MLNHSKNLLLGRKRRALTPPLLLLGTFVLTRTAQPAPLSGRGDVSQIVEVPDGQGRSVYINREEQDLGFRIQVSARGCGADQLHQPPNEARMGLASLIRQAANRHQLDPDLIHAIVNVESGCDSRALSRKGAMGLMQLIPGTARRFGVEDPFDPEQNIEGGTSYLDYLFGLFNGDLTLSLAAYNAGENSVLREGGVPGFPETREYVQRVESLYQRNSASKLGSGAAGLRNPILGGRKLKGVFGTRNAGALAPRQKNPPLYKFVDSNDVVHIEQ
jgi:hypothetical protein